MNASMLGAEVSKRYQPFIDDILQKRRDAVHSVHIYGSALTPDYDPKISDINSVIVLNQMDLRFLEQLAPLGKKYGKKGVAAPLIMTPVYIENSVDVFPVEFLNIKLVHHTIFGDDVFNNLVIRNSDLRRQCEREMKVKLIGMRQGYLSAAGDTKVLARGFTESLAEYIALFKGIIVLLGKKAPQNMSEVLSVLEQESGVSLAVFRLVLKHKQLKTTPSIDQLNTFFEDGYRVIEKLGDITDALDV